MRSVKYFFPSFTLAFALLGLSSPSNGQEQPMLVWKLGAYKGLKTGVSTMQDVVRKFGKPKLKTFPQEPYDPTLREWHYEQHESEGSRCVQAIETAAEATKLSELSV
jgi:hypothetical protein